jgi:Raf kinase inhibitor-like YbhB/YbcL family protein
VAGFELVSDAFAAGGEIPRRHTCEGEDLSPALRWTGAPEGTGSLALIVDDPDAPSGTFVHWVAWGIPPEGAIEEGASPPAEGRNGFGRVGYGGPCPPPGHGPHRYVFRLHALSSDPQLEPGAGSDDLTRAIDGRVLGTAELLGTYERR